MEVFRTIITVLLLIISVLMIVVVLMQKSKEGGLGSAFGGDGGGSSLSAKGKAASKEAKLQKLTKILAVAMGILALAITAIH